MHLKRWIFFGIPLLLGAVVANFSPLNVLDFGWAKTIYRLASIIFPAVVKMQGDYELGQVAKLYYSSIWICFPLTFIGAYIDLQRQADVIVEKCREKKIFFILFFCVFSLVCGFLLFNFTFESKDVEDVRVYLSFHSRLGMSLVGAVAPIGASAMIAMAAFGFRNIGRIFY